MSAAAEAASSPPGLLAYLPVWLFGAVMGLTGLSAAWHLASLRYGFTPWIANIIGIITVGAFVAVLIAYLVKCVSAPAAVKAEFSHPIAGNVFGTLFVSMLLLPLILAGVNLRIAQALWITGTVGILIFAWLIATRWLRVPQNRSDVSPTWIIPVIGLLDIPLAVPVLSVGPLSGIAVVGLAVGLFFTTPLFTLIFERQLFEAPMPDSLKPTMFILLAPTAVGFSSYVATTGHDDLFTTSLYVVTLFLLTVLVGHLRHLPTCCPFRVSWWAVSFPLTACAIAGLKFASYHSGTTSTVIALTLLAFATLAIAWLFQRTVFGILRGELRALSTEDPKR
jgi:tellurite resistance protein